MSEIVVGKGSCCCGAVEVTAQTMHLNVGACHCDVCRKWCGGPLLAVDCGTEVSFTGHEHIGTYQSSEWAERGFCKHCGTPLFYRLKEANQYVMPVDLFEKNEKLVFDHQIFIDYKPSYYSFANETKTMTGEEVFAQYAPPEK